MAPVEILEWLLEATAAVGETDVSADVVVDVDADDVLDEPEVVSLALLAISELCQLIWIIGAAVYTHMFSLNSFSWDSWWDEQMRT